MPRRFAGPVHVSLSRYQPIPDRNTALVARIWEIAMERVRYGYWRIFSLLRREGWQVNHKRVHRLYRLEGLNLRSKRPEEIERLHTAWSSLS